MRAPFNRLENKPIFCLQICEFANKVRGSARGRQAVCGGGCPAKGARIDVSGGVGRCLKALKMFIFVKFFIFFTILRKNVWFL
ncbi:MAG TPA: hypothetical protein DEV78_01245 [Clostridiales bacterium]|nr:hypothetical protein [Clostridiales bacterium]